MLGRRSHERFNLTASVHGTLSILCDAILHRTGYGRWTAISREAGLKGETLVLDLRLAEMPLRFAVTVADSRPVVVGGALRHRLRLDRVDAAGDDLAIS